MKDKKTIIFGKPLAELTLDEQEMLKQILTTPEEN